MSRSVTPFGAPNAPEPIAADEELLELMTYQHDK
jgi:hypothetical protein